MSGMPRSIACLALIALLGMGLRAHATPLHLSDTMLDVPYVPTPPEGVKAMLALAGVTRDDVVYDLGCGDGRIVIAAAKDLGATGVGVDLDPQRIAESRENARRAGVDARVTFLQQDLFETDIRRATVVTLYLLGSLNERLRPKILAEVRPGTRIVSHAFRMGEWEPDDTNAVSGIELFLWIVPANVSGTWRAAGTGRRELVVDQHFQRLAGSLAWNDARFVIREGRVHGDHFELTAEPATGSGRALRLSGQVRDDRIDGVTEGTGESWSLGRDPGTASRIDLPQ